MRKQGTIFILAVSLLCLAATVVFAGGIKDRMVARVPAINALKSSGVVGENNKGFLEFRAAPQKADVVNAENADRAKVYKAIAAKTGASPSVVGQRRAAQIAQQAPGGTWLQKPTGEWYRK